MSSYKLIYFNIKGRAEPCRYMFAIAGVKYEDKRVTGEEWGKMKATNGLGQLPILIVDGKELPQSRAINRYVARENGFYGSNSWEQTEIDIICQTLDDVQSGILMVFAETDDAKKDEVRKKFIEEHVLKVAEKLEKLLKQNNNGTGWFVGDKISLADVYVFSLFFDFLPFVAKAEIDLKCQEAFKGLMSRFQSNSKIAEWIKNRPETD